MRLGSYGLNLNSTLYDGGVRLENNYQAVFLCKQIEIIDLRLTIDMPAPFSALIRDSKASV